MAANTWWDIFPPSFKARRPQREPPGPADSEAVYGQQPLHANEICTAMNPKWPLSCGLLLTSEVGHSLRCRSLHPPPPDLSLSFSQQPCDQICLTCRCCVSSPQSQSAHFCYVLRIGACRTEERRTECLHLSHIGENYSGIYSAEKREKMMN